jgi:hypothetical protein
MAQSDSGIGNVTPNAELVQMAMSYSRSYMLCAAVRLGIAMRSEMGRRSRGQRGGSFANQILNRM